MNLSLLRSIGPGLIFAAAAVGVSHLVQSTRAGAMMGMSLLGFILLANLLKYPAFRFGPQYAAATGTSLLQGYRNQGRWALWLYAFVTVATMFTVQAGVTVVTAGLVHANFGLESSVVVTSGLILLCCAVLLVFGRYRMLENITRVLVAVLTVSTLAATILVIPEIDFLGSDWFVRPSELDLPTIFFIAALVGWMPSAIDIAVWQSIWTLEKAEQQGSLSVRSTLLDFNVGYIGTVALALCFMFLGVAVFHGEEVELATSAGGFAAQVISMYERTLGAWAGPLIGVSAMAVMFSTTLAVLDGFPRALSTLVARFQEDEKQRSSSEPHANQRYYWISMCVLSMGATVALALFLTSLPAMIDLATTLSFLTAPLLAMLNHRAIFSGDVQGEARPGGGLRVLSLVGIVVMSAFALFYLYLKVVA